MAADLAATPTSGFWVQACGDAHLSNFGAYASPSQDLVADVNDFDETLPGPWEWDVKRLAVSFEIAGRDRDFKSGQRARIASKAASSYRETMRDLAKVGNLDAWYRGVDVAELRRRIDGAVSRRELKAIDRNIAKARNKTRMRALSKLTRRVDGELRLASDPPVLVPIDEMFSGRQLTEADTRIRKVLEDYRATLSPGHQRLLGTYRYVDTARKVVGVGSVGTRAWVVLFAGRDDGDPLFLQVKEAQPSVLEPYTAKTEFESEGERVVEGQRLMQAASDVMLGWLRAEGPDNEMRDFYVRQLWDQKGSATVELMSPGWLEVYAEVCGAILARAHARSGDRIAIASYLGGGDSFDRALARFAAAYADQNQRDYDAMCAAVEDGRIEVHRE